MPRVPAAAVARSCRGHSAFLPRCGAATAPGTDMENPIFEMFNNYSVVRHVRAAANKHTNKQWLRMGSTRPRYRRCSARSDARALARSTRSTWRLD